MPSTCDPWPSRSGVLGTLRGPRVARDVCIRGLVELCRGSRVSSCVYVVWCNFVLVRAFRFLRSLLAWTPAGFPRRIANTWRVPLTDTLVSTSTRDLLGFVVGVLSLVCSFSDVGVNLRKLSSNSNSIIFSKPLWNSV